MMAMVAAQGSILAAWWCCHRHASEEFRAGLPAADRKGASGQLEIVAFSALFIPVPARAGRASSRSLRFSTGLSSPAASGDGVTAARQPAPGHAALK